MQYSKSKFFLCSGLGKSIRTTKVQIADLVLCWKSQQEKNVCGRLLEYTVGVNMKRDMASTIVVFSGVEIWRKSGGPVLRNRRVRQIIREPSIKRFQLHFFKSFRKAFLSLISVNCTFVKFINLDGYVVPHAILIYNQFPNKRKEGDGEEEEEDGIFKKNEKKNPFRIKKFQI